MRPEAVPLAPPLLLLWDLLSPAASAILLISPGSTMKTLKTGWISLLESVCLTIGMTWRSYRTLGFPWKRWHKHGFLTTTTGSPTGPSFVRNCARYSVGRSDMVKKAGQSPSGPLRDVCVLHRGRSRSVSPCGCKHAGGRQGSPCPEGIAPLAFNALVIQNHSTIRDIGTPCQRLDELQAVRLQPSGLAMQPLGDVYLRALIRQIIREELQFNDPPSPSRDSFRSEALQLRDLVKEDLASMTGVMPTPPPNTPTPTPSYSAMVSRPPLPQDAAFATTHLTAISAATVPRGYYTNVRTPRQAFPSDRPVWY